MIEALTQEQAAAYLARIGIDDREQPTLRWLRELHRQHLLSVPFENLDIHLGTPISLDRDDLAAKVIERRRGGFCYELNGLFAALLTRLGFDVRLLGCRVYTPAGLSPPFDHLALSVKPVDTDQRWFADVGFGRHSLYPLAANDGTGQRDPYGVFRLEPTDDGDLDVFRDDEPQYRIEQRPRALADFGPTCWYQQTSPESHFRIGPVCSRLTETGGLITLAGTLLVRTENGERTEQTLETDAGVLAAYDQHFGVRLDRVPRPPAA